MRVERRPRGRPPGPGVAALLVLAIGLRTPGAAPAADEGARLYRHHCSSCHGLDGRGLIPASPPLAGHAPRLLWAPGGRAYLARVPLFGLTGEIEVLGRRYSAVMASFDHRSDAEIAAILNHVLTAWGNDRLLPRGHEPLTAAEVARERAIELSAEGVRAGRPPLAPR